MTVQKILKIFKEEKPDSKISMILDLKDKIVIIAEDDSTNSFDIFWTLRNGKIIPYSPLNSLTDMAKFQDALSNPVYKRKDSLKHYGIKGQRWGVRRFDYEPVRKARQSKREDDTSLTNDWTDIFENFKNFQNSASGTNPGRLNLNNLVISRSDNDLILNTSNIPRYKDLPYGSIVKATSLSHINPNFSTGDFKYTNNCPNCSLAVELNKRGYTNFASNPNNPLTDKDILNMYRGYTSNTFYSADQKVTPATAAFATYKKTNGKEWCDEVMKYVGPPGSHGFIMGQYKPPGAAGGHIFNYTVLKDGSVQIEDGQIGYIMTLEAASMLYNLGKTTVIDMTNASINLDEITKYGAINNSSAKFNNMYQSANKLAESLVSKIGNSMRNPSTIAKGSLIVNRLLKR